MNRASLRLLTFLLMTYTWIIPATVSASTIETPQYRFNLQDIDNSKFTWDQSKGLIIFSDKCKGFSANINVHIQEFKGTLDEFIQISKEQFKFLELSILTEVRSSKNDWSVEYAGYFNGRNYHLYSRAIATRRKVFLVTAATTKNQWNKYSNLFRRIVDRFETK